MTLHSLADGNWLQRRYWRWAERHYHRFDAQAREQAIAIDLFLYSRRGIAFWLALLCAIVGTSAGLTMAGMPALLAVAASLLIWVVLPLMGMAAWIAPGAFIRRHTLQRSLGLAAVFASLGGLLGFVVGHISRHGRFDLALLGSELAAKFLVLAPAVLVVGIGMVGVLYGVASVRKQVLQNQLERVTLQRERDAAARQVAEAQLKLLQGQIQPHFIFNTLSALQHWVDTGDVRAGALLRSLTAFLRGSTELLDRTDVTLADEAVMVGHYLAIMRARLGERLTSTIDIAPEVAAQRMPPGILLTLVENAVEHGAAPALAGGHVHIDAAPASQGWTLRVADDGAGLAPGWREGVGLANSRQRLVHHYGSAARLELRPLNPGVEAVLLLPWQPDHRGET
jgi:sensor histidine kinase YesM